jgi:homocitrate synthase
MCPRQTGDAPSGDSQDMVAVEGTQKSLNGYHGLNGTAHSNGVNGHSSMKQHRNPYAPRASDFLNNVSNFKIIESTLRGLPLSFRVLLSY